MKPAAWIILGLALAARLLLAFITAPDASTPAPLPWYNDEPAHLNYVQYLYLHNRLPVQTASVQEDLNAGRHEYYQPPLYYYLARPFYALGVWLTPGDELYWVRIISALMSAAGLLIFYSAVRTAAGPRPALLGLALAGFAGLSLRHGYLVSNDSLFFALACLVFALSLEALVRGWDRSLLITAVLVGVAGMWTKASFLLILPLFPLAVLLCLLHSEDRPSRLWSAVVTLGLPLLAIVPWYLWNLSHYGQALPLSVGFGSPEPWTFANFGSRLYLTALYFVRTLVFPFEGLWGSPLDAVIYPLDGLVFLALVILGFRRLWRIDRPLFRLSAVAVGLTVAGYLWLNLRYPQAEARYLLPALPFLFNLMVQAVSPLRRQDPRLPWIILGLWVLLPWATLLF